MSAQTIRMDVLPLLVMVVVEDGNSRCLDLLVDKVGSLDADALVKAGRSVNRRLGMPIFVRALIPQTCGGAQ